MNVNTLPIIGPASGRTAPGPGTRKDMENRATTFALDIVLELGEKRLS
jgi:hypothetical protein